MKILKSSFRIKTKEAAVYRENVRLNFFFGLIPLLINIYLWSAIYRSKGNTIGGYTYSQMITYFFLVFIITKLTDNRNLAVQLSELIQEGTLNNSLLKPVNFITYQFSLIFSEKVVLFLNISIPLLIFILLLRNYIVINLSQILMFMVSVFLSLVLNYIIYFIIGTLTVWLEEISALLDLWRNVTSFLSGAIFPLTLLTPKIRMIISFLPFKYTVFVPIDIYMGNLTGNDLIKELFIQIVWIVILAIVLKLVWRKAIEDYSGYGS